MEIIMKTWIKLDRSYTTSRLAQNPTAHRAGRRGIKEPKELTGGDPDIAIVMVAWH